jgi:pimeloyl-ACP methyl ester carboxylesterase
MKLVYKFGIAYGFAELIHQLMYWRRYIYFNNLRITHNESPTETWAMLKSLMNKNPRLFQRTGLFTHTEHIHNEDDLYDALTSHSKERPANKLQDGCSRLHWRYSPFAFELFMKTIRQFGNLYMKYIQRYERTWHKTIDGYYSVWHHNVPGSKPLLFFPGLGLGAIPYAKFAKSFDRTVHIVEVPNIGYSTPLSNSQVTPESLYSVIKEHVDDGVDIFSHSFGSVTTAMYLNIIRDKPHPLQNVIICDGFTNPYDIVTTHIYPFVEFNEYYTIYKKPRRWLEFAVLLYFGTYTIDFQAWAKRFHNMYTNTTWRDYPNTNIHYVYSKNDIAYDTEYIGKISDCTLLPKGGHGYSIFGIRDISIYKEMFRKNSITFI